MKRGADMVIQTWLLAVLIDIVGTSTIGYSGVIMDSKWDTYSSSIPPNTNTTTGSAGYHNIKGWGVPDGSAFYNYSITVDNQGVFVVPIAGIYLITANIRLKASKSTPVEISVRHKTLQDVCYCRGVALLPSNSELTVSISCFVKLIVQTNIVVNLKNDETIQVVEGSTLSLHYFGQSGNIASFVLPVHSVDVVNDESVISASIDVRDNKFFNELTEISNLANLKIPCSGIYLITLNMIVKMNKDSVFNFFINDVLLLSVDHEEQQQQQKEGRMITFIQSLKLQKNDLLRLNVSNMVFLDDSIYGVARVGDMSVFGVSSRLQYSINNVQNDKKYFSLPLNFDPKRLRRPHFENSGFITNSVEKEIESIHMGTQGIYLFSIALQTEGSAGEDIDLVVLTKGYYDDAIKVRDGLRLFSKQTGSRYVILSGLLRLHDYDEVTVLLSKNIQYKDISLVSIMKVSSFTFASTAVIPMTAQKIVKCVNKWKPLFGFEMEKDEQGKERNDYDLNKYFEVDKFVVPSSGIYLIMAEAVVQNSGELFLQNIVLALGRGTAKGDFEPIIYSYALAKKKQRRLTIRHIVKLRKDDWLMFQITCNKTIEFVHKTKLHAIFLSNAEDASYMESSQDSSYSVLESKRKYKPAIAGTYFVTITMLVDYKLLKREMRKVELYVYPMNGKSKGSKKDGIISIDHVDPNEMGLKGLVTLQASGFIQTNTGDTIITGIDIGSTEENDDDVIVPVSESFSCISLSNPSLSQYKFKSIQQSKLQFMIKKDYTLDMFDPISLIYKSPNARFFGPQFIVDKPMIILYDFSMALEEVKGEFRIQVKIRPRPGVTQLSEKITVVDVDNLMLKTVGVLKLEQSESIEIMIDSKSREVLRSSYRSWSIIELLPSTPQRHWHDIISANSFPTQDLNAGGYLQLLYKHSSKARALPIAQQLYTSKSSLTRTPTSKRDQLTLDTARLTVRNTPIINTQPYAAELEFPVQGKAFNDVACTVTFLELRISMKQLNHVTILLKESRKSIFYTPTVEENVIMIMCLMEGDDLVVKSKSMSSSSTTGQHVNLTLLPIDALGKVHGFCGGLKPKNLSVGKGESVRIVDWITDDDVYFSSKMTGLYPVNGAFILKESGYYYVMISIVLKDDLNVGCEVLVMGDTMVLFSRKLTTSFISMSDVLHLPSNLFIQLLVKCHKTPQDISFKKHSVFSIYLIDSHPSFVGDCMSSSVSLQTNIRNDSFNVPYGTNFELKCYDKSSAMGDFLWKRDNKIVYQINGGRGATLKLENLTSSENGMYHCEMKRGHEMAVVNPIQITVVDPRPQLGLSSNIVYVGENYSANKLLAWVKVEAKNVETNQDAAVKFTIAEGNEDGNFYTDPSTSMSHTSLFFRSPFDFERNNEYKLKIRAENLEYGGKQNSATVTLTVRVLNRNEHRPKFHENTKTQFTLNENTPPGVVIYRFNASDADQVTDIRYSLTDPLDRNLFTINETTGDLKVIGNVDFEDQCEIVLAVCAWDHVYRTCTYIQIVIINENDNPPYFIQSLYTADITAATAEPRSTILSLRAADEDTQRKENEGLKFEIVKGNDDGYFSIDGNNIKLVRRYENYSKLFQLYVNVSDGVNKAQDSAVVKLHVFGKDPIPKFSEKMYYTDVVENSPKGSTIIQLPLTYDGQPINSKENLILTFTIKNLKDFGKKSIEIDRRANVIVAENIDREQVQTIFLLAEACVWTAGLKKCGTSHVTINVTDENDNSPVFEKDSYGKVITDTKMNETSVLEVRATDQDSWGPNSQIYYVLDDPYNLFRIDNVTGEIFTTRFLSEEDGKYFELSVTAKDRGNPERVSEAVVATIEVADVSAAYSGLMKNWEFWILPCLVSILLLLMLAVATMTWKYRRSRRRFQEYLLEQPAMMDNKRNSFLTYMAKPTSSQEETMYMSCGTLPSAYNSQGEGLNNKRSSVMFTENGYTSFPGSRDAAAI